MEPLEQADKTSAEVAIDALHAAGVVSDEQHGIAVQHVRDHNAAVAWYSVSAVLAAEPPASSGR